MRWFCRGIRRSPGYFGNDDRNDSYRHNGSFKRYEALSVFFYEELTRPGFYG